MLAWPPHAYKSPIAIARAAIEPTIISAWVPVSKQLQLIQVLLEAAALELLAPDIGAPLAPELLELDAALLLKTAAVEEELELTGQLQIAPVTLTVVAEANPTSPVLDNRRPFTVVPAAPVTLMDPTAASVPTKAVGPANIAEVPTINSTLQANAPLVKTTAELAAVVNVDPI